MVDEPVIPDDPGGEDVADPEDEWDLPVAREVAEDVKSGDDESAYNPTPEDDPGADHSPAEEHQ